MENCRMGCVSRAQTLAGEKVMRMAGVPRPLFLGGVGAVLVVSFALVEWLNRGAREPVTRRRWNFLSLRFPAWCFRQRWLKPLFQVPVAALFAFLIYAGFAGDRTVNLTPTLTWTVWWAGLIFLVLFLGKAWCFVCPWDFAATLAQGVGRLWGARGPFTLGLRWPRALRNIYLAIGLFVLLTWLELGYRVTASPRATAVLALVMVALCVVPALLFEKRAFCRHGCMIGRISGLYAMFAPVEVRCADVAVCRECRTRDCFRGNHRAPACPTGLLLPAVKENTYCIQCGHCARSCPRGNVAFNVRPFAADLTAFTRPRADESLLAIILLALTSFHGLTMTPFWEGADGFSVIGWLRAALGTGPLAAFTLGMTAMVAVPIIVFWLLSLVTQRMAGDASVPWTKLFPYFAYSLLPVALFYHLAHNAMHFFMEAQLVVPLLSDPLGRCWDLFGTAALRPGPLLSAQAIWWLQVALVLTGHVAGIVIAHHASRRLYAEPRRATWSLVPMLGGMVLYSWFSLWILHLDMNMRSTLM
jgi:polyferredoxin